MRLPGTAKRKVSGHVELNMVPMIDVVFQLLLFLMVLPSAGEGYYLPTNLPETLGPLPKSPLVDIRPNEMRIDLWHVEPWEAHRGEARIMLNQELLAGNSELRERLRAARSALVASGRTVAGVPVTISPDMAVWHRHVVAAFDAAVDAGFQNVQFTVPK